MSEPYNILALVTDGTNSTVHVTLSTRSGIDLAHFKQSIRDEYEQWDGASPSGDKSALTLQEITEFLTEASQTVSEAPRFSLDRVFVTTDIAAYNRFNESVSDMLRAAEEPSEQTNDHKAARRAHISEAFFEAFKQTCEGSIKEQYESSLSFVENSVFDFKITRSWCGCMIGVDLMSRKISAAVKLPIEEAAEDQYNRATQRDLSDADMVSWARSVMKEPLARQFTQAVIGAGSVTKSEDGCAGLTARKRRRQGN